MEMFINWSFLVLSLGLLAYLIRKPPLKDWVIVYFFRAFYATILDSFVVYYNLIKYPIRFLADVFTFTILFDFFVYPTLSLLFTQITDKDRVGMIIIKAFLFSIPISLLEWWFEKNTDLISFINWNIWNTYFGLTFCFILIRSFLAMIRYFSKKQKLS